MEFTKTGKEIITENYSKPGYPEDKYITLTGLDALEGMLLNMLSVTCRHKEYEIMKTNIENVFKTFKKENGIEG